MSITDNLGDVKTTMTHPSTTPHGRVSADIQAQTGISDGLIRIGVGLESIDDIIADLDQGLSA